MNRRPLMESRAAPPLTIAMVLPLALSLAACGGGGGGGGVNSTPAPPPAAVPVPPPPPPPPPPAPPPPPPPSSFDTSEYRRSNAATGVNALAAYQAGATGRGIVVGVVDSGIDPDGPEFAGRISAASADLAGNRGIADPDGHGTAVAGVIAAARNDIGTHGVAFDSTILALRTDSPGTCGGTGDGCSHNDNNIAAAIDRAIANNARVINMSLGGSPPNGTLVAAINRATAAGIVLVISAGNDRTANPDEFALVALDAAARGQVIIAGALSGSLSVLADFSNAAGSGQSFYLAALGVNVRSYDQNGQQVLVSGTSFAAPAIAGAAALLAEAFPTLTGQQIVQLLLSSGDDLGIPGTDAEFGHGRLNLARAFQPQGQTALADVGVAAGAATGGVMSPAMGDARVGAGVAAVVLDSYGRAYTVDLSASLAQGLAARPLAGSLLGASEGRQTRLGGADLAVSLVPGQSTPVALALSPSEARQARLSAGRIAFRLGSRSQLTFGIRQSLDGDAARSARGRPALPFLVADGPETSWGFAARPLTATTFSHRIAGGTAWLGFDRGEALVPLRGTPDALADRQLRSGYDRMTLGFARRVGAADLRAAASWLGEDATLLGARFDAAYGAPRGSSLFLDAGVHIASNDGWYADLSARQGWTGASGGVVLAGARLRTSAYAAEFGRQGFFSAGDVLAVRLAQPLRVDSGGISLRLPQSYDYATQSAQFGIVPVNLAPDGREITAEALYGGAVFGGSARLNAYWRRQPGNIATAPDDAGIAIRFDTVF